MGPKTPSNGAQFQAEVEALFSGERVRREEKEQKTEEEEQDEADSE